MMSFMSIQCLGTRKTIRSLYCKYFSVRRHNKKTPLLTVKLIEKESIIRGLYDPGADCSLIDPHMVKQLKLTHRINTSIYYVLQGAFCNRQSKAEGEIKLKFQIGPQVFSNTFIVTKLATPKHLILGNDFWFNEKLEAYYNNGKAALVLNDTPIPVSHYYSETDTARHLLLDPFSKMPGSAGPERKPFVNSNIKVYRTVRISPHSFGVEKTRVLVECNSQEPHIDYPDQYRTVLMGTGHKNHGKDCGTQCSSCADYKFLWLKVFNNSGGYVNLQAGKVIGLASSAVKAHKGTLKRACAAAIKDKVDYHDPERLRKLFGLLGHSCPDRPLLEAFIKDLMRKYPDVIYCEGEELRVTDVMQHHIAYTGSPIFIKQYPISEVKMEGLLKTVDKLLSYGSLIACDSPYNFPVVPVYKGTTEDGSPAEIRVCVDYSAINTHTPKDRVVLGMWDTYMTQLAGSKIFSKLDMKAAFHQIPLSKSSIEKTAFSIRNRRYAYRTCPMGLSNLPASLARLMNQVFSNISKNVIIYLDDFVIHSKTLEEQKVLLDQAFQDLSAAKLQLSFNKCSFFVNSTNFLGGFG